MEPIEINAGGYYLRALRNDERLSDVNALEHIMGLNPDAAERRIAELNEDWTQGNQLSWAVCEQTDPSCLAVILVDVKKRKLTIDSYPGVAPEARYASPIAAVKRFVASLEGESMPQ